MTQQDFDRFFNRFFPCPILPERELCEDLKWYENASKENGIFMSEITSWRQLNWLYVSQPQLYSSVTAPYGSTKFTITVTFPDKKPVTQETSLQMNEPAMMRMRHFEFKYPGFGGEYIHGKYQLIQVLCAFYKKENLSEQEYVDMYWKTMRDTQGVGSKRKEFIDFAMNHFDSIAFPIELKNRDQYPLTKFISRHSPKLASLRLWGKDGKYQTSFPTLWYKYLEKGLVFVDENGNCSGGSTFDQYPSIPGFPFLQHDFITRDFQRSVGVPHDWKKPSESFLKWIVNNWKREYGYFLLSNRWNKITKQEEVTKKEMIEAVEKNWNELNELGLNHHLAQNFYLVIENEHIITLHPNMHDYILSLKCLFFNEVCTTIKERETQIKNPNYDKNIWEFWDKTLLKPIYKPTKEEISKFPYTSSYQRKYDKKKLELLKRLWRHTFYLAIPTTIWTEDETFDDILSSPNEAELTEEEIIYQERLFGFMREYPLPRPLNPGLADNIVSKLASLAKFFHFDQASEMIEYSIDNLWSDHQDFFYKCNHQWDVYVQWCEANVAAQGKEGYVHPNEPIEVKPNGQTIYNTVVNLGVLSVDGTDPPVFFKIPLTITWFASLTYGEKWYMQVKKYLSEGFNVCIDYLWKIARKVVNVVKDAAKEALLYLGVGLVVIVAAGSLLSGGFENFGENVKTIVKKI